MKQLVLIGGGHSHIQVLLELARRRSAQLAVTVVSREVLTPYSGMLPGVIAGHYPPAEALIDLAPLCARAGAALVHDEITGLDPQARTLATRAGERLDYDLVSINCGSAPGLARIEGAREAGVPVKPISEFLPHWDQLLARLRREHESGFDIVVVGAGAGGIEIALALDYRVREVEKLAGIRIGIVDAADTLAPGHAPALGQRLAPILASRGIAFRAATRIARAQEGSLLTDGGKTIPANEVLWVTSAAAQTWPATAGLDVDERGFVRVDASLRSLSHPNVFATGDIASFAPAELPKAGVYAVRQGPLLARNLLRASRGEPPEPFRPQSRYLALISTGNRYAVASRGNWTAEGAWAWRWKDWLDRRFVRRFRPR